MKGRKAQMDGKRRNPFKTQRTNLQEDRKLVGAYLPLPFTNHLRLLSVYFEKSLQNILQEIITQWSDAVGKSEKEIMDVLIDRAVNEWQRRVLESGRLSKKKQEKYLEEIQTTLKRKKVSKAHLEYIMKKLKGKVGCIE